MYTLLNLAAATLVLTGPLEDDAPATASGYAVPFCFVHAIPEFDVEVPAQQAGQIRAVEHHEGDSVENGAVLAQVDDAQQVAQREVAFQESKIASEQATNDVNVRYAREAFNVAKTMYEMVRAANRQTTNAVTPAEIQQRWFEAKQAELQIEQARFNMHIASMTAVAREADVRVADTVIERHKVRAPFEGQVVKVLRHAGEWVSPGDPVVHIARMDKLRVIGKVKASELDPYEVNNRSVNVMVQLSRGRQAQFDGKIVYVHPRVSAGGEYEIWADVKNRQENDAWILQDGRKVTMHIQLDPNRTANQIRPERQ